MSKPLLGEIIGCKDETSSWHHLNGFPYGINSNIGLAAFYYGTVCIVLYPTILNNAQQPNKGMAIIM